MVLVIAIVEAVIALFNRIMNPKLLVRRIYLTANHVVPESEAAGQPETEQLDLFTDYAAEQDKRQREAADLERLPEPTKVTITYFVPDKKKTGGAYVSVSGTVKKIDDYERAVILCEGTSIPIDDIFHINGKFFDGIEAG